MFATRGRKPKWNNYQLGVMQMNLKHTMQDEFVWRQDWQVGDLIIWDNRCAMHRRDAFDPSARRVLHRTQIKGSNAPARAAA